MKHVLSLVLAAGLTGLAAIPAAMAGPTQQEVVRAEILSGWETPQGTQMAGLRLTMAPGWKTYWRAPGDAGIPPSFDWSGSGNFAGARIFWPRPDVFSVNGMRSIGYKHEVVLPIELTPGTPGHPIRLNGVIELGVCQDICVPVELRLRARLPAATPDPASIRRAMAQRPVPGDQAGVGAVICTAEPISDGMRLTARIAMPPMGGSEIAVIEASDPGIWVSEAKVSRQGNRLVAVADLVPPQGRPFALDRSAVRITLLSGNKAVDIRGCEGG